MPSPTDAILLLVDGKVEIRDLLREANDDSGSAKKYMVANASCIG
jgi:hypothetical protein